MIDGPTLSLALAAGMVAALNPCGFALLPAYLTLVVVQGGDDGRAAAVGRAAIMTAAMTAGFVVVFGGFGLVVVPLALSVERFLPWATVVIGLALVLLGGWLLSGRELLLGAPRLQAAPTRSTWSMVGYGVAYAVASLSCTVAPFLAVTTSAVTAGGAGAGLAAFVAYGLGMGLLVGTLAVSMALVGTGLVSRMRRLLPYVSRVSGALLVAAGLYVAYYGWYELRVFGGGSAQDPVVDAAVQLQGTLARTVSGLGPGTVVLGLVVLVVLAAGGTLLKRHSTRRTAASGGS